MIMNLKFRIKNLKLEHGFTLVELLIVIVIIGVLSAILMANFVGVRQRARDAQRKSDLRQIQSALELYRSDQGSYPLIGQISGCGFTFQFGTAIYIQKYPCDPNGSGYWNWGAYWPSSDGKSYKIAACLENSNDTGAGTTSTNPPGVPLGATCASSKWYVVENP